MTGKCQQRLVERLPPAESGIKLVPVGDRFLANAPAEIDFSPLPQRPEINQAHLQVFDLAAEGVQLLDGLLGLMQSACSCYLRLPQRVRTVAVPPHGLDSARELPFSREVVAALLLGASHQLPNAGQEREGCFECEQARHSKAILAQQRGRPGSGCIEEERPVRAGKRVAPMLSCGDGLTRRPREGGHVIGTVMPVFRCHLCGTMATPTSLLIQLG